MEEVRNLSTLLDIFLYCSGLCINRSKSAFMVFSLWPEEEAQCSWALGMLTGTLPIHYLGQPDDGVNWDLGLAVGNCKGGTEVGGW